MSNLDKNDPNYDFKLACNYRTFIRRAYYGTGSPKSYAYIEKVIKWINAEKDALIVTEDDNYRGKIRDVLTIVIDVYLAKNLTAKTREQFSALRERVETFTTLDQFDEIISDGLELSDQL